MARNNKSNSAPAMQKGIYPQEGAIEELRGLEFQVPVSVTNKRAWIESNYREKEARKAAEAERAQREAAVLKDRSAEITRSERAALQAQAFDAEIESLRHEVQEVRGELSNPDAERLVAMNTSTVAAMGRTLDATERVDTMLGRLGEMETRVQELHDAALNEREISLGLVKNYQTLLNGVQKSNGEIINDLREQLNQTKVENIKLSDQIGNNWEIVQRAVNIEAEVVERATAECRRQNDEQHQQFMDALSIGFSAIGLTQEMLEAEAARIEGTSYDKNVPIINSELLSIFTGIASKYKAARLDMEVRTDIASAKSAGRLDFASRVVGGSGPKGFKKAK